MVSIFLDPHAKDMEQLTDFISTADEVTACLGTIPFPNGAGAKQLRSHPGSSNGGEHIDGDDVARAATVRLSHNESHDGGGKFAWPEAFCSGDDGAALRLSNQRKRPPPAQIGGQFGATVRDFRRKTLLINVPQGFEILRPEVSQGDFHRNDCRPNLKRPGLRLTGKGLGPLRKITRNLLRYLYH